MNKKELKTYKDKTLDKFCYVKVKIDELEVEKKTLQLEILDWPDSPGKDGVEVPPYGTLRLGTRENWTVLKIPALFKKVGKDTFLEICSVAAGKLKKAVGTVGFKKLEKLKIIEQGEDSEFLVLKRSAVMKKATNGGK
jgi:hypothetical protein